MSALGQKQTCAVQEGMSALPPKADIESLHCQTGRAVDIEPVSVLILQNSGIFQLAGGDFQPIAAWKVRICNSETIAEFKKCSVGGLLGGNSISIWRDWTGWLGRQDSNLGMAESKSAALPLGYAPPVTSAHFAAAFAGVSFARASGSLPG